MKVYVYHTPELIPATHPPDCAIAIDVLRATSTIATALAAGAEAVQAFSSMDELMQVSEQWSPDRRLRAGERGGKTVEGCDLGNSPLDCTPERVGGRRCLSAPRMALAAYPKLSKLRPYWLLL